MIFFGLSHEKSFFEFFNECIIYTEIYILKNCGGRPVGPKYPSPPVNATGSPGSETECDIIKDSIYTHELVLK